MKILVLFSGTHSIEKVYDSNIHDIRSLDLDKKFNPTINIDILKWNYRKYFKNWIPDYIHASPVCKGFTPLTIKNRQTNLSKSLLYRSLNIIEYVKRLNPKLKYTIENPKGKMKNEKRLKNIKQITTSYCMYGFLYMKPTTFWYGGFDLKLKSSCRNTKSDKYWCDSKKNNNGSHKVRIGVSRNSKTMKLSNSSQIPDTEHFKELRKIEKYKGYTNEYFRYRIPEELCIDIKNCVLK